jgi:type II secretion system protein J
MKVATSKRRLRSIGAFTLMEVMAAIFLTAVIVAFAVGFFINLSDSSTRATRIVEKDLRAATALNRVARDLSNAAMMVRGAEESPLSDPWFFVAENHRAFAGSDRIKFIMRGQRANTSAYHRSDLMQVAYQTRSEADGSLSLYRWTSPSLAGGYDTDYPLFDDERNFVLVEGLNSFTLRFLDQAGAWLDEWDSTRVEHPSDLPHAVEIELSIWSPEVERDGGLHPQDEAMYTRQIILRQRPVNLHLMMEEKLQAEVSGGQVFDRDSDSDSDEFDESDSGESAPLGSVADCTRRNWKLCVENYGEGNCGVWSNVTQVSVGSFGIDLPWCQ